MSKVFTHLTEYYFYIFFFFTKINSHNIQPAFKPFKCFGEQNKLIYKEKFFKTSKRSNL